MLACVLQARACIAYPVHNLRHKEYLYYGPRRSRKPVFGVCEQQRRRPACAFVIRLLESITSTLVTSDISLFELVSVAEQDAWV